MTHGLTNVREEHWMCLQKTTMIVEVQRYNKMERCQANWTSFLDWFQWAFT